MADVAGSWLVPGASPMAVGIAATALALAVCGACRSRATGIGKHVPAGVSLHVAFCVLYAAFILVTSSTVAVDPIDDRLMAPLAPSLLIALTGVLAAGTWRGRAVRSCVVALAVLLAGTSMAHGIARVRATAEDGAGGFNTKQWRESPLMTHLGATRGPAKEVVFSNVPDALYLLLGIDARMAPARGAYNSREKTGIDAESLFVAHPELDGATLVWRDPNLRDYLFPPEELRQMCQLGEIARVGDGTIYRVSRREAGARDPK